MRALITGATGFVGRSLVEDLLDRGHDVRVLAPDVRKARAMLPEAVAVHPGSPVDRDSVRDASSGADTIFQLAESEHPSSHRSYGSYSKNLLGTRNILSASESDRGGLTHRRPEFDRSHRALPGRTPPHRGERPETTHELRPLPSEHGGRRAPAPRREGKPRGHHQIRHDIQ